MKKEEFIIGGKLHGTHGLKGDLKIEVFPPIINSSFFISILLFSLQC
jgi:ribosomal 30S subunit maturation factor RimM